MSNKEKILDLYYNQHLKQNEIAKLVGTTAQYVSKVVRADKRNKEEKEKRKIENSENFPQKREGPRGSFSFSSFFQ